MMQCDICFRTGGRKLPFLCPTDARNQLYEARIQNAQVLLEQDTLKQEIATLLSSYPHSDKATKAQTLPSRLESDEAVSERAQAIDRTQQIIAHADELQVKLDKAREEIAKKKDILARRRSELASATNGVEARRARQNDEVERAIRMIKYKWNNIHSVTATSRAFLCGEAARLYGLRKIRRTSDGSEEYRIGGISIVDLRAMNSATSAQISTALSHIVHLLILSTHYLAIRLPAEITLPHRDYPLPTIFPLLSSYKYSDVPFPGSTPGQSSTNSPVESRHMETPNQPRPRPLFLSKPLPLLAIEDPAGYALFLEGVTLLAYNIAWLCKSQGAAVGEKSDFEDICNIGKNMFNLLLGSQQRSSMGSRVPSAQSTPSKGSSKDDGTDTEEKKAGPSSIMGRYSHGSAHSFLGNADGTEFVRSWKLQSPMKFADQLKKRLMSELTNAEWEVVNQEAWTGDDEVGDDAVVVGARQEGRGTGLGMQSFMSMRTVIDAVEMIGGDGDKKPANGWTKLRPRS